MSDIERIEESHLLNYPSIDVFAKGNFFTQGLLMTLYRYADNHGYKFYLDVIGAEIRMKIYNDVES